MWAIPLIRTARMSIQAILTMPEAKSVAFGVATGTAVGLVPKGNLIAFTLGVVLCSLRLNLIVALGTAVGVSLLSVHGDPFFDAVGFAVLTWQPLDRFWTWCAERPFAAWTQFHNTVVMGSLLVALAQIYPTYWVSKRLADRLLPTLTERLSRMRLVAFIRRLEWGTRLTHAADA